MHIRKNRRKMNQLQTPQSGQCVSMETKAQLRQNK